jgi:hypothetical protein
MGNQGFNSDHRFATVNVTSHVTAALIPASGTICSSRTAFRLVTSAWLTMATTAVLVFVSIGSAKGSEPYSLVADMESAHLSDAEWSVASETLLDEPKLSSVEFFDGLAAAGATEACSCEDCNTFHWEYLPRENIYPFYLADTKQSRMAGQWVEGSNDATLLDATLGGRFGILRYVNNTKGPFRRGVQLDFEGSAQVRLDMDNEHDVRSVDFRAGVPLSFSFGRLQTRIGYYHNSSHLGDEFLIKNPGYDRKNYVRDVLLLGAAYWVTDSTRVYGEATWAFYSDISEPWELIFGIEDAPRKPTGLRGAPFYAVNGRLREEVNFSGAVTIQAGWAWRSSYDTGLLRVGLHYFNGLSNQFSFYQDHEELLGLGLWYDF